MEKEEKAYLIRIVIVFLMIVVSGVLIAASVHPIETGDYAPSETVWETEAAAK